MEEEKKKPEVAEEETEAPEEPRDEGKPTTDPATPEVTEEAEVETEVAETPAAEEGQPTPEPVPEKTFTQEQVNALVGKARAEGREKGYEQARREALERYGVESDDELDELFGNGSRYGELTSRFADAGNSLKEARTELALVKSGILPARQGDVKAILGASGLEVTEENIASLLPTHPEWKAAQAEPQASAQTPNIPQPKPEKTDGEGDGSLGPDVEPDGIDDGGKEKREYAEAMRKFGI